MTTPLTTAYRGHRALTVVAALMTALLVASLAGLVLDDRQLLGQPVWLKPAKFAASFVIYALTLAWLLNFLRRARRTARWTANVVAVMAVLEVGLIAVQAARGHTSHFNSSTPSDELIWRAMGGVIVVLWLGTAVITVLLWRDGLPDPAATWAARLGMVLLLAGLLQGFLMVVPRPGQLDLDERGIDTALGAHAVGVSDGGPGMALTGWSTTGGDLRVGHFVGIHGLQAVLLFAILLSSFVPDVTRRVRLVFVFSAGYLGLLALVTWQALRGQPLTAPDALTVAALVVLLAAAGLAALVAWRRPTGVAPAPGDAVRPTRP